MYAFPTGPGGIGQVIDRAFQLTKASFSKVWYLALAAGIAGSLADIWQFIRAGRALEELGVSPVDVTTLTLAIVGGLLSTVLWCMIFLRQHAVAEDSFLEGDFGVALRRLPALIVAGVLYGIVVGGGVMAVVLWRWLGLVILIPVAILGVSLILFQVLVLIERRGPVDSLGTSHKLVWGNWWRTFALLLIGAAIVLVLYFAMAFIVGLMIAFAASADALLTTTITAMVVALLLQIVVLPFFTALTLSIYYDLKLRKQGTDLAARVGALAT